MDRPFLLPTHRARSFLSRVMATRDEELACGEILEILAEYVDVTATGQPPTGRLGDVQVHLGLCPDCADMVATLTHLAQLESEGRLPDVDDLWERLQQATARSEAPRPTRKIDPAASNRPTGGTAAVAVGHEGQRRQGLRQRIGLGTAWPRLAPAALAVAAVAAVVFAWWEVGRVRSATEDSVRLANNRVAELRAELGRWRDRDRAIMEVLAEADQNRFLRREDGSWLRLFYNPERTGAVLVMGDLAGVEDDDRITCWLKHVEGEETLALAVDGPGAGMHWWLIEGDEPLGAYEVLQMQVEPEGKELFQVAIAPEARSGP